MGVVSRRTDSKYRMEVMWVLLVDGRTASTEWRSCGCC